MKTVTEEKTKERNVEQNKEKTKRPSGKKAKEPLYIPILRGIYLFFDGFFEYFRKEASEIALFLADFFSGLPLFFSYLRKKHRKNRKKRKEQRSEKRRLKKRAKQKRAADLRERNEEEQEKQSEISRNMRLLRPWLPVLLAAAILLGEILIAAYEGVRYIADSTSSSSSTIRMVIVEGNKKTSVTIPASVAFGYGGEIPYFECGALADALGFQTVGTAEGVRYTFFDGKTAYMKNGTNRLIIGEDQVDLKSPVRFRNGKVYAPMEFLTDCMTGVTVSYSKEKKTLTIARIRDPERSTSKETVYEAVSVRPQRLTALSQPVTE